MKTINKKYLFFIPQKLLTEIANNLRNLNYDIETYDFISFIDEYDLFSIKKEYKDEIENQREFFKNKGYINITCMGAIYTNIEKKELRNFCEKFFGINEDINHKIERINSENKAIQHFEELEKNWKKDGDE